MKASRTAIIADILSKGGVGILPASTVYGLFCKASSPEAVARIYSIKGRGKNKPLQLFVAEKRDISRYASVSPAQGKEIGRLLPGPNTLILALNKRYRHKFPFLKAGTAGFRVIGLGLIKDILKTLKEPLAATSANISGQDTPKKFRDINGALFDKVDFSVKDDSFVTGRASKVVDLTGKTPVIIRR